LCCFSQELPGLFAGESALLFYIKILKVVEVLFLKTGHPTYLIMRRQGSFHSLLTIFFMLLEYLSLSLQIGLPHLRDVTDFDVGVFKIREEKQTNRPLDVLVLQLLTYFKFFLCLNYFHLVEKLSDFRLTAIDSIEELILLF
jgi:hypothetical protein